MAKIEYMSGIPRLTDGIILKLRTDEVKKILSVLPKGEDREIDDLRYEIERILRDVDSNVAKVGSW